MVPGTPGQMQMVGLELRFSIKRSYATVGLHRTAKTEILRARN